MLYMLPLLGLAMARLAGLRLAGAVEERVLDALPALQVLAVGELAALAGQLALQGVQQHVAGAGGFAGTGRQDAAGRRC